MVRCPCGMFSGLASVYLLASLEIIVAIVVLIADSFLDTFFSMRRGMDTIPFAILPVSVATTRIGVGFLGVLAAADSEWLQLWGFWAFPASSGILSAWYVGRIVLLLWAQPPESFGTNTIVVFAGPVLLSTCTFLHSIRRFRYQPQETLDDWREVDVAAAKLAAEKLTLRTFTMDDASIAAAAAAAGVGAGDDSCLICLMTFEKGELAKELMCGHVFHAACVDRWLEQCARTRSATAQCPLRCDPQQSIISV